MNNIMIIAIVPFGYAEKVIKAANEAGATDATILRARGVGNSPNEGLFSFKIEPEEEIILIAATEEVTSGVCSKIHEEFGKGSSRSGSIYIFPIQKEVDDVNAVFIEQADANGYSESFNSKFRTECLDQLWFRNLSEEKEIIEDWRLEYNHIRPHMSLDNLTLNEYAIRILDNS